MGCVYFLHKRVTDITFGKDVMYTFIQLADDWMMKLRNDEYAKMKLQACTGIVSEMIKKFKMNVLRTKDERTIGIMADVADQVDEEVKKFESYVRSVVMQRVPYNQQDAVVYSSIIDGFLCLANEVHNCIYEKDNQWLINANNEICNMFRTGRFDEWKSLEKCVNLDNMLTISNKVISICKENRRVENMNLPKSLPMMVEEEKEIRRKSFFCYMDQIAVKYGLK